MTGRLISISRILIANRGEIAVRIAKTLRRLGIDSVAAYSQADKAALHVQLCDMSMPIGGAAPQDSYLNIENIITAAQKSGAQAIHPGYGFLSENADFAKAVEKAGLIFIGPKPETITAMGSKSAAKDLMMMAGVAVTPGYQGGAQDLETFKRAYEKYEAVMKLHEQDKIDRPERVAAWHAEVEERKQQLYKHKKNYIGWKVLGRVKHTLKQIEENQNDVSHDILLNKSLSFLEEAVGRIAYDDNYYSSKFFGPILGDVKKYSKTKLYVLNYRDSKAKKFCPEFMDMLSDIEMSIMQRKYELGYVDKEVVTRYAVSVSNLGWINCDRFYQLDESQKMDLQFASTNGDNQYYLIFKNIKSMIGPSTIENGQVIFRNMPKGEDVRIVALSIKGDDAFMASQDLKIGGTNEELAYRPAKISDIRDALKSI